MLKLYAYTNCDACRKAKKWLKANQIAFEEIPIRERPPGESELKKVLIAYGGELRRLFNTSGSDYKKLGLKDQLSAMKPEEAFALLTAQGNLVKRPFLVGDGIALIGFKEAEWVAALQR